MAYDLKVFFTVIVKQPSWITTADVLTFIKAQRAPRRGAGVLRLEDGEAGFPLARSNADWPVCRGCSATSLPGPMPG
ncbi:MAG TPA: hypothetical protein VIJ23_05850 [Mycobacterium sp.]